MLKPIRVPPWHEIRCAGLTPSAAAIEELARDITRRLGVLNYKNSTGSVWLVFMGGTGTGKSSFFNAVVGYPISSTGVERPKTNGPIVYTTPANLLDNQFPFQTTKIERLRQEEALGTSLAGSPNKLTVVEHARDEFSHMIIVDTPDVDSLTVENRRMVEELYLFADVVVFVLSQEKYADEVPFKFLLKVQIEQMPLFVVLNKVETGLDLDDVLELLGTKGFRCDENRFVMFPFFTGNAHQSISHHPSFVRFRETLLENVAKVNIPDLLQKSRERAHKNLKTLSGRLLEVIEAEKRAAAQWVEQLELIYQMSCRNLLEQLEERFGRESRPHLQEEIRRHFNKYDLLGKPRRILSEVLQMPLRVLGIVRDTPRRFSRETLYQLLQKTDYPAIQAELTRFNRAVLENLCPAYEFSELRRCMLDPDLSLSDENVRTEIGQGLNELIIWLEETFNRLAGGISKGKELGIYSTSILWGCLILALEVMVGGGISLFQAVVDTAVAPFVTRGAVELFAYRELQKLTGELGSRYQQAILRALHKQKTKYFECIESFRVSEDLIKELKNIPPNRWGR